MSQPHRSILYSPAANEKAILKGHSLAVDGLIFDLEDSVLPKEKVFARKLICQILKESREKFGTRRIIVRINGLKTPWGADDLLQVSAVSPDAILIPKVESGNDLVSVTKLADLETLKINLWAMIETPLGVLNAQSIASSSNLEALVMGTNDLIEDIGGINTPYREALLNSLNHVILVARAYKLICLDGVYNSFRDQEGLEVSCIQGRNLGFDGKTLIHPSQISTANRVFAPSKKQIEEAKLKIKEFARVKESGIGVAVVNGQIVESLHVQTAKNLIRMSKKIIDNP